MEMSAAFSHEKNEDYMSRFQEAYRHLQNLSIEVQENKTHDSSTYVNSERKQSLKHDAPETKTVPCCSPNKDHSFSWRTGIDVEGGVVLKLSDRPLLCSALSKDGNGLTVGSSDHALYSIDINSKQLRRTLFTKTKGHTEWVTCVAYTDDSKIISGGMDSKLCVWAKNSTSCVDLVGHRGSVSGVACFRDIAVSCSYDKTLKLWNHQTGKLRGTLIGHKAPVLLLESNQEDSVLSGDRGGSAFVWDVEKEALSWRLKKVHKGHITALRWVESRSNSWFLTGGQDGVLRMWDLRDHSNPFKEKIHGGVNSNAAINGIQIYPQNPNILITYGADQTLKVLDIRNETSHSVWEVTLSDFPYCSELTDDLVSCGCGDGTLNVFDINTLEVKGSNDLTTNAIRFLHSTKEGYVCGGDDGNVGIYTVE